MSRRKRDERGSLRNLPPADRDDPIPPVAQGQRCRVCGCTDDDCASCIERTGQPCWWVEEDLCSACGLPLVDPGEAASGSERGASL